MKPFDLYDIEYMAARFNPLPLKNNFLNSRYDWQKNDNGVEWPYYRFFYHLSKMLQPELIVELGSYQGTAAAHFAAGCYPKGGVITIDHHTDPGDEQNQRQTLDACERFNNLFYIQGWTNPVAAQREYNKHALGNAYDAIPRIKQFQVKQFKNLIDILFIDSWHNYDNAMLDWEHYKPLLNNPALVICDDIQEGGSDYSPISGMFKFWQAMPEPKFLNANLHPGTNMGFFVYDTTKAG